jgi:ankyrin repeat protein
VFCQLEVLRHCLPSSVRHILEELPESLDETYERILKEIRKPNQGHAHRLLQCLVAAVRPLRVKELAEVLAVDFNADGIPKLNVGWRWEDQEEAVMSACSSLVMIVRDGELQVVQFSHFSVKEYLTADRLAESIRDVSRYHIRLEAAHAILAQACLSVLLRLDDRIDRDSIESFPLARYAAQYWATHARFENAWSRVKDAMECLFDTDNPHFATWLWIYNEDLRDLRPMMSTMCPEKPKTVPLYHAARLGFRELAEHLIAEHPEHVNARGGIEATPMHVAAREGHADILALLLDHGAVLDRKGIVGHTPLYRAVGKGSLEAVQCLLDRGADINARSKTGSTPLSHAVSFHQVESVRMLLECGARVNTQTASGETSLHEAVKGIDIQSVRLLLKHGADVNARNNSGMTPSQCARQQLVDTNLTSQQLTGLQEIVELLS